MKKLLILSVVCILSFPVLAWAITPGTIPGADEYGIKGASNLPSDTQGLLNVVASIVGYVYTVFFIVAVLFIIFAAFNYLTGGDAPEKIKSAHSQLIYAAVAIAVALLALSVQVIVGNLLQGKTSGSGTSTSGNSPQYYVPLNSGDYSNPNIKGGY